MFNFHELLKQD